MVNSNKLTKMFLKIIKHFKRCNRRVKPIVFVINRKSNFTDLSKLIIIGRRSLDDRLHVYNSIAHAYEELVSVLSVHVNRI